LESFLTVFLMFVVAPGALLAVVVLGGLYLFTRVKKKEMDGFQWFMTAFVLLSVLCGVTFLIFDSI
jgi:hypothetical protein